jgi:hypothetical protein
VDTKGLSMNTDNRQPTDKTTVMTATTAIPSPPIYVGGRGVGSGGNDLFQPTQLDVEGSDLAETIQSIEQRGGMIQRMEVLSVSGYRLIITWPVDSAASN